MSLELQNIWHALHVSSESEARILNHLGYANRAALNAQLEQCLQQRAHGVNTSIYVLQQAEQAANISYAITPLLCSVLNYPTHYVARAEPWLMQFYTHYFRTDALASAKAKSLSEMQLCFDLQDTALNASEFYVASVLQALLDPHTQRIVTLGAPSLIAELKQQLEGYYLIEWLEVPAIDLAVDVTQIDLKKLFWKRKDDALAQVSQRIAYDNSRLVAALCQLSRVDAERFIEDLMYGEHVFEKVSVLGEFSDTVYKHQQEQLHRRSA